MHPALIILGLLAVRWLLYWSAFRLRKLEVSPTQSVIIAGGPLALGFALPSMPWFLMLAIGIAVAVFLSNKYGSVPLYPEALAIGAVVETVIFFSRWFLSM